MWIRLVVVACTAAFHSLVHVISSTPAVDGPRQSLSSGAHREGHRYCLLVKLDYLVEVNSCAMTGGFKLPQSPVQLFCFGN
jgi:hypothetical protein